MEKTAVITGAGRGIGAAIAEKLASEHWDVAILARKPQADGDAQCAEIARKYGVAARYYVCDISKADDRENTVEAIIRDFGGIDALVNNAGVAPKVRANLLEMSEESFDYVTGINLKGTLFMSQLVGRHFAERKSGVIVNIGSCSATVVSTNRGEYCISKAGVAMVTQLFAVEMAKYGVNVYEIRPGVIATDMTACVKEKYDKLIAEGLTLQPRWGQPEDVAKAVAMMVRGDIAYSTGQVVNVGGGLEVIRL